MKNLSIFERKILINQLKIQLFLLENLNNSSNIENETIDDIKNQIKILEKGYKYYYSSSVFDDIDENEISEEITDDVLNILEMYDLLQMRYESLSCSDKNLLTENDLIFSGFDAQDEFIYYDQCCFILNDLKYYKDLKREKSLNTHFRKMGTYEQQYQRFLDVKEQIKPQEMNVEHIKFILGD